MTLAMKPQDKPVKDAAAPILKYRKPKQTQSMVVDHYQENTIPHHLLTV
jgi:hypothetical protein